MLEILNNAVASSMGDVVFLHSSSFATVFTAHLVRC